MPHPKQPRGWSEDIPSASETVAKFRLQLRNVSLFALLQKGFLTMDREENLVKKGPRFNERPEKGEN